MRRIALLLLFAASATPAASSAPSVDALEDRLESALDAGDVILATARAESLVAQLATTNDERLEEARFTLGSLLFSLDRIDGARAEFEACVELLERGGAPDSVRVSRLSNLAESHRALGDAASARRRFEDALDRTRAATPPCEAAVVRNNLAGLYRDLQRYEDAEPLLRAALEASNDPTNGCTASRRSTAYLNLAEILRLTYRTEEALPLYRRALDLAREAYGEDSPWIIYPLNQFAELYAESGRPDLAAPLREEAARVAGAQDPPLPLPLAQIQFDGAEDRLAEGDAARAIPLATSAAALRSGVLGPDHAEVAIAQRLALEATLATTHEVDADTCFRLAERLRDRPRERVQALVLAARAQLKAGATRAAISTLEDAVSLVETRRRHAGTVDVGRARLLAEDRAAHEVLFALHFDAGNLDASFAVAEKARARVLLERIDATRRGRQVSPETEALLLDMATASQTALRLRWFASNVDDGTTTQLARVEARLDSLTAAYHATTRQASDPALPINLPTGMSALGSTPTVVYFVGASRSFGLFVDDGGVEGFELTVADEEAKTLGVSPGPLSRMRLLDILGVSARLDRAVDTDDAVTGLFRAWSEGSALRRRRDEDWMLAATRALTEVLLPPGIRTRVLRHDALLIVPDGLLHLVPFAALQTEDGAWIDHGPTLRTVGSIASLRALERRARSRESTRDLVLSVGDPIFSPLRREAAADRSDRLAPLPWTREEVGAVVGTFANERTRALLGFDANESRVRDALTHARIVHLATHGIVGPDRHRLRAALALTPNPEPVAPWDDGFLHLYELEELGLGCELAVLSACESQAGRVIVGEGASTLARGFLAAGADRVVATQWRVNDRASAELVSRFFTTLAARDDGDAAAALRAAQRAVRATPGWEHPYFWAAFGLSGLE